MAENEDKIGLPAVIAPELGHVTAELVQLKITTAARENKLTLPELEKRALTVLKNEDGLKAMSDLLKDTKEARKIAETTFKAIKDPYLKMSQACDAGKKLFLEQLDRIDSMYLSKYNQILKDVADKKKKADLKVAQNETIKKIIETNMMDFSNQIVSAVTVQQITDVENKINLEKTPSMAKKYGELHAFAIERYAAVLGPILKSSKEKLKEIRGLNTKREEAENNNDPDKIDEIDNRINLLSDGLLQNNAEIGEAVIGASILPVTEAQEVLPATKVKRTHFTYEIADEEVALKKARQLLDITINKEEAKVVLERLKKERIFDGTDDIEHVVDGIKYIATREREAL